MQNGDRERHTPHIGSEGGRGCVLLRQRPVVAPGAARVAVRARLRVAEGARVARPPEVYMKAGRHAVRSATWEATRSSTEAVRRAAARPLSAASVEPPRASTDAPRGGAAGEAAACPGEAL